MNNNVLIIGIVVGCVNYLFRYLPLRLRAGNARPTRRGPLSVLLDTIGIASICALLIVSSVPEILSDSRRLLPTLVGFTVLGLAFLEDAQHYYAHAAERVGLWNSMENHNFFILLKYQF